MGTPRLTVPSIPSVQVEQTVNGGLIPWELRARPHKWTTASVALHHIHKRLTGRKEAEA